MRSITIYLFILTFSLLNAESLSKPFYIKDNCTIYLPRDWEQIPNKIVYEYTIELGANIDYVFQPKDCKEWFGYSYLGITINPAGKIPISEIKKMSNSKNTDALFDSVEKDIEKTLKDKTGLNYQTDFISQHYDEELNILWSIAQGYVPGDGYSITISGALFTENGLIQVSGNSSYNHYIYDLNFYKDVIKNIIIDEKIKYQHSRGMFDWLWE